MLYPTAQCVESRQKKYIYILSYGEGQVLTVAESVRVGLAGEKGEALRLQRLFPQSNFQLHHLTSPGHEMTV